MSGLSRREFIKRGIKAAGFLMLGKELMGLADTIVKPEDYFTGLQTTSTDDNTSIWLISWGEEGVHEIYRVKEVSKEHSYEDFYER